MAADLHRRGHRGERDHGDAAGVGGDSSLSN
jgi:hypothetical protein